MEVGQHLVQERLCQFETVGALDGSISMTTAGITRAERLVRTAGLRISNQELGQRVEVIVRVLLEDVARETSLSPAIQSH